MTQCKRQQENSKHSAHAHKRRHRMNPAQAPKAYTPEVRAQQDNPRQQANNNAVHACAPSGTSKCTLPASIHRYHPDSRLQARHTAPQQANCMHCHRRHKQVHFASKHSLLPSGLKISSTSYCFMAGKRHALSPAAPASALCQQAHTAAIWTQNFKHIVLLRSRQTAGKQRVPSPGAPGSAALHPAPG
jgi:hypothetical protein